MEGEQKDVLERLTEDELLSLTDYVVLRQNERDDSWSTVFVDVTAETPDEAIEQAAKDKGGEGRYVAFPNEWWVGRNVKVKKIAEVEMERQDMV